MAHYEIERIYGEVAYFPYAAVAWKGIPIGAGAHLFPSGEAKFVPLKVRHFEEKAEFSGAKLLTGLPSRIRVAI